VPESREAKVVIAEVKRLRARVAAIEADYDAGLIDGRRYATAVAKVTAQLEAAQAAQDRTLTDAGVAATLRARDPVAAYKSAPLMVRRAVIDFLMVVRLLPWQRGARFVPESVQVLPRASARSARS
jgi:nucleoid-associated protein YgaU